MAAVLAEATGMSVLDYARSRLFEPLGIDTRPAFEELLDAGNQDEFVAADFAWPVDGSGLHLGWTGLKLRPADLARVGQMMLDGGKWKGKQVVPADWVQESTTKQVDTISRRNQENASGKYGYQWWVTEADEEPAYFAWGGGGQLLEVVPSRSLVVVVASEIEYGQPRSAGSPPASSRSWSTTRSPRPWSTDLQPSDAHAGSAVSGSPSGNEWCSWATTHAPSSRRNPRVNRSRRCGVAASPSGVSQ